MATIPISDGIPKNSYVATASQTIFPYTFWVKDADHIAVYVNGTLKAITTDYTVSAVQEPLGANVVFNSGLSEDDTVVLVYDPEYERTAEYTGTIRLTSLNTELTYMLTLAQNNKRLSENAIRIKSEETVSLDSELPALTGNGGRVFALKDDLSGVEFVTVAATDTVVSNFEDQSFNGDTSTTDFTLTFTPVSANSLLVWVDDVRMRPVTDYTVSGTTLSFVSAPGSGTDNIVVLNTSSTTSVNTPTDGSVTTAKLADTAVTSAKLNTDAVTTAKVVDNAITLDKLEDGTQGDILYYGASGAPARLGAGTNGQVLQSGGAGANPSWGTASGFANTDITTQPNATVAAGDTFVFTDVDDSSALKSDTVQGLLDLVPAVDINGQTGATVALTDEIVFADADDSNNIKKDTVQGIVDLATTSTSYGGIGTYAIAEFIVGGTITSGSTTSGANLKAISFNIGSGTDSLSASTLSGTWRNMGANVTGTYPQSLWLRIS